MTSPVFIRSIFGFCGYVDDPRDRCALLWVALGPDASWTGLTARSRLWDETLRAAAGWEGSSPDSEPDAILSRLEASGALVFDRWAVSVRGALAAHAAGPRALLGAARLAAAVPVGAARLDWEREARAAAPAVVEGVLGPAVSGAEAERLREASKDRVLHTLSHRVSEPSPKPRASSRLTATHRVSAEAPEHTLSGDLFPLPSPSSSPSDSPSTSLSSPVTAASAAYLPYRGADSVEDLVGEWDRLMPGNVPRPRSPLAPGVRAHLQAALRREGSRDWSRTFRTIAESDFLTGRASPSGDRDPFVVDLVWATGRNNLAKIDAGRFGPRKGSGVEARAARAADGLMDDVDPPPRRGGGFKDAKDEPF